MASLPGRSGSRWLRQVAWLCLAFALYLLLAIALTFPLVMRLGSDVPHDLGDPLLNTWIMWWNAQHLPLGGEWWNGPFFYPARGTLSFSEHLLGLLPITSPVQWLGGGPLLAYNVALLLSFPLCAMTMHLLCLFLTRRHDLALIGGLAYGFAPYRMGQLAHLQTLSSYYMPLALLGLHGYLRSRRPAWLALFAVSWLMQSLCNGYYLLYFSVLVVLWLAWFARDLGHVARVLVVWALAALPLAPIVRGYALWHAHYGFARTPAQAEEFSPDVVSLLQASALTAHWQGLAVRLPRIALFPGLTLPLVLAFAVMTSLRTRAETPPGTMRRRLRLALALGAAFVATAALSAAVFGPWQLRLGGLSMSVKALHKPLGLAFVLLAATVATSDHFVRGFRRRSAFVFYLAAAIAMWVLALGPTPRFRGMLIWDKPPYWWLMGLPGMSSLRQPSRFAMVATLCLCLAAVLALERLLAGDGRRRRLLVALVAAGIMWDGWILPLPLFAPPERIARLESSDLAGATVLELPLGLYEDVAAMYRSTHHRHSLVNGYSGYFPPHYEVLRTTLDEGEAGALAALRTESPLVVAIDASREAERGWDRRTAGVTGARLLGRDGQRKLYLLPTVGSPPRALPGKPLPIRRVTTSRNASTAGHLVDGDRQTSWTAGRRQKPGDNVVLELTTPQRMSGVVMSLGAGFLNYPRHLVVETSLDGEHWQTVWRGETAAQALAAALAQRRELSIETPTADAYGRCLRLTQTARSPVPWTIVELTVLGSSP